MKHAILKHTAAFAFLCMALLFAPSVSGQIIPIDPPKKNPPPAQPSQQGGKPPKQKPAKQEKTARTGSNMFTLKIGGGMNYFLGALNEPMGEFDSRMFSGQFNGMLGYRYGKTEKASALGVFASYGIYSKAAAASFHPLSLNGNFLELEGGIILHEFYRLSAGYGMAKFYQNPGDALALYEDNYISATTGFCLGPKNFKFETLGTFMFSQVENRISFRPSLALSIKLDFAKRKS